METAARAIEIWTNALRNGKMSRAAVIKAAERAMWNLDERAANAIINERDVASQTEIFEAAKRYESRAGYGTAFDQFVMLRYRVMWLAAAPTAEVSTSAAVEPTGDELETCGRCGGAGGWRGWPGFTCFRCHGRGRVTAATNRAGERGIADEAARAFVADMRRAAEPDYQNA